MDITQYTTRIKYKSLPPDFNHQDGVNYKSSYEYTKTFSNYHFDKWRIENEGEWYHKLGRFVGDWDNDVEQLILKSKELTWDQQTKIGKRPGFKDGKSPMRDQEEYDRKLHGLHDTDQTNLVLEDYLDNFVSIKKMVDHWCLENVSYRCHVQWPGQCFGVHIDKLWHRCPTNPDRIVRIVVNLADYEVGQVIVYGNSLLTQWKKGDVHIFDTLNVPHGTVNLSIKPRPNITITGLRTPQTDEKLLEATPNSKYWI
ncbi:hypothetical protein EBU71_19135 [bacterium]|nr:hypothetical protein [Candidatus Elulimicrobium humile]